MRILKWNARRRARTAAVALFATAAFMWLVGAGEVWGDVCLRTYRGGLRAGTHNAVAQLLQVVGVCRLPQEGSCSGYGRLLDGVDVYVIELPGRAGRVNALARHYGVVGRDTLHPVNVVAALTPNVEPCNTECSQIAQECTTRANTWELATGHHDAHTFAAEGEPLRPFALSPKVVACAMSHVKALQVACANTERKNVALVMEDDADFGPMEHWPLPLTAMLSTLPEDWTIVNAAPSNVNNGRLFGKSSPDTGQLQFFRPGHLDTTVYDIGTMDYGAVAVAYNLSNPAVCEMASRHGSPAQVKLAAAASMLPTALPCSV
jgi:hypothetical protein|eukprot:COSAG01_NODE_12978_length_1654_cov_2.473312_1_plen_319_part_00